MKATILCYHKVGSLEQEGKSLNIEPETLRSHVRFFFRKKIGIRLAKDLNQAFQPDSICLTFDDAYLSAMQNAPDILQSFNARGSFYAVAHKIGAKSDWDGSDSRPLANLDLLVSASQNGHEIGNHTCTHRRLTGLTFEEQQSEIVGCHEFLLSHGIRCETVCYPFGSYNQETLKALKDLNYRIGLSLKKGNVPPNASLLELPRIAVGYSDKLPKLLYKISLRPKLRRLGI